MGQGRGVPSRLNEQRHRSGWQPVRMPDHGEIEVANLGDNIEEELARPEVELFAALAGMLSKPGFLLPLVAAQRQYRQHYYGLSAAALLEDVFFDAFANYLSQHRPSTRFERPERGHKEWDYRFEGLEVSHKVGEGPSDLAALWDATVQLPDPPVWTFDSPIVYLSSAYVTQVGTMLWRGQALRVRALRGDPAETLAVGHRLFLVKWPVGGAAEVLWASDPATAATPVRQVAPFDALWRLLAAAIHDGVAANHLEVLRTTASLRTLPSGNGAAELIFRHRPGISMFPMAGLANVTVTKNNRAVLLPRATVAEKMHEAVDDGLFVPLPLWYRTYASARPPDLYLAQRAEFDALFSPANQSNRGLEVQTAPAEDELVAEESEVPEH